MRLQAPSRISFAGFTASRAGGLGDLDPMGNPVDTMQQGEEASDAGKRWVQWAEAAVTENGTDWATKQGKTSYNLNQFWMLKADHYQEDPTFWDGLDLKAQKVWAALSEIGLVMDNPPAQKRYADEAQTAYGNAKVIADRLGNDTESRTISHRIVQSAAWYQEAKTHGVDDSLRAAIVDSASNLFTAGMLGVPYWAWAGAAALLIFVMVKR